MLPLIFAIGSWAPIVGLGIGPAIGAVVTIRLASRAAGAPAPMAGSLKEASAMLRSVLAGVSTFLLLAAPLPMLVRIVAAALTWLAISRNDLAGLLRELGLVRPREVLN